MIKTVSARIGRVKMKSGGAAITVLHRSENEMGENWRGKIITHAKRIANFEEPNSELVGFFILGVFSDGQYSTGYRMDDKKCPIPRTLMPSYVEEVVRREMLIDRVED